MIIVVDTETTNLTPENGCVWQLAACAVEERRIVAEFSSQARPRIKHFQAPHRQVVQKVCGLTAEALLGLLDEPPAVTVANAFEDWLSERCDGALPRLTAFNRGFDQRFLEADPWQLPPEWFSAPCLMEEAVRLMKQTGYRKRFVSLAAACEYFGVEPPDQAHAAMSDTRAAARLAIKMGVQ